MPAGRPSKYPQDQAAQKALHDMILELGAKGLSEAAIAHELGVPRTTLRSWAERNAELSSTISRAMEASQAWWEKQARTGVVGNQPGQINPAVWQKTVSSIFRKDYSERVEVDQTVKITDKTNADLVEAIIESGRSAGLNDQAIQQMIKSAMGDVDDG